MVRGKSDSRQHADWRALKMENKNNYSRLNYLISLEMNSLWSKKWPACQTWCQWCSWGTTTVTVVGNIWIPKRIKRNEVITKHCMLDVNQYWILSHKTEVRDTLLQFYSLNFSFIACVKVHFANFKLIFGCFCVSEVWIICNDHFLKTARLPLQSEKYVQLLQSVMSNSHSWYF